MPDSIPEGGRPLRLAFDVDGVVADLESAWYAMYNAEFNDTLTADRVTSWDVSQFVKPECGPRIFEYLQDPTLYERVAPYPAALGVMARIRKQGHHVVFVTSCTYGMVDQKARWLEKWGLVEPGTHGRLPKDLVVTHEKHLVGADVLIDDGAHNVTAWLQHTDRPAVLMSRPHNLAFTAALPQLARLHRVGDWHLLEHLVPHFDPMRS